jgi:hypothetical protein
MPSTLSSFSLLNKEREREPSRRNNVKPSVDFRMLARNALNPIEKKLKGIYSTSKERHEKEISTSNLVQMLIQDATSDANLVSSHSVTPDVLLIILSRLKCIPVGQHGISREYANTFT